MDPGVVSKLVAYPFGSSSPVVPRLGRLYCLEGLVVWRLFCQIDLGGGSTAMVQVGSGWAYLECDCTIEDFFFCMEGSKGLGPGGLSLAESGTSSRLFLVLLGPGGIRVTPFSRWLGCHTGVETFQAVIWDTEL